MLSTSAASSTFFTELHSGTLATRRLLLSLIGLFPLHLFLSFKYNRPSAAGNFLVSSFQRKLCTIAESLESEQTKCLLLHPEKQIPLNVISLQCLCNSFVYFQVQEST
ncbi:unnamed protein product [Urochloa humidicola]